MTIMARLKQETSSYHEELEANPYSRAMSDGTLTLEAYREMMERFYGFYKPLEAQLSLFAPFDVSERQHSPYLVRDLRSLGSDIDSVPLCDTIPQIDSEARALGSIYVLEGATLGGQIISRQLKRFDITPDNGCAFFNSYGSQVGEMWKAFIAAANTYAETHGHEDEIVAAASDTFITFGRWLMRVPATT